MALLILHAKQPHIMPTQTRPGIGPVSRKETGLSGEVWVTAAAGQQRRPVAGDEGAPGSAWWDCYTPGPARLLSRSTRSISFWQDTFVSPSQPAPSGKHYGFPGRARPGSCGDLGPGPSSATASYVISSKLLNLSGLHTPEKIRN